MKGIVIVGAGGHARVVMEILRATGCDIACFVADEGETVPGVPLLKGDDHLAKLRAQGLSEIIIAVGDNATRVRLAETVGALGYKFVSAISPHAVVSPSAHLGQGVVVMPGAIINAGATIEDFAVINSGAVVEHDSKVGPGAHLGPLCGIAGNVVVGPRAFLGLGAKVIPGIKIGADTIVGAGAVVIVDLPANVVAVGVPARIVKSQSVQ